MSFIRRSMPSSSVQVVPSSTTAELVQALGDDDSRSRLDQSEVGERLRKVAEVATRCGVELLGVQPQRRRNAQELLHKVAGGLWLIHDRQRRHEPERADQEAALLAGKAVVGLAGAVAQYEAVLRQVARYRIDGGPQALVVTREEPEDRRQERGGVEGIRLVVLAQHAVTYPVLEDVHLDLVSGG